MTAVGLLVAATLWAGYGLPAGQARASVPDRPCAPQSAHVVTTLPPAVRAALQAAYDDAGQRPRDGAIVGRLAMMLHAYEQYRDAAACYRALRRIDAASPAWPHLAGLVHVELGEHAAAAAAFTEALRLDAQNVAARLRLADTFVDLRELDAAGEHYATLVRDLPELALAHYGLGRVWTVRGDPQRARAHYQQAVQLAPEFGAAHYALAMACRDIGLSECVGPHLEAFRKHGRRRPAVRDPLLQQVRAMRETARELLAQASHAEAAGRLDEAIALQHTALDRDPAAVQAHVNLIALYGRTGRFEQAARHYAAALKLQSGAPDAHYNYGVLLASRQDAGAAQAFERALAADPFHAAAHNNLAGLLARGGDYERAAAHYRQALANDPQHETARLNLGRVLALLGRTSEAIGVLEHALVRAGRDGRADVAAAIRKELQRLGAKR